MARREGIALCLSGGGFRAALFHLGALRRLHELGILQRVAAISSVSGGSIISAFLASRLYDLGRNLSQGFGDWQRDVADPFRAFCSRDFRTWPIIANALWNWIWPGPLVRQLERRFYRRLTPLRLRDLPEEPRFIFCATDLTHGVGWEFTRAGAGSWRAGYMAEAADWPLARAVTASACFPPLFGPMAISAGGRRVQLSDGGVYDNMGLEPVWKEWSHVLVSDCGAPFEHRTDSSPLRRLLRYTAAVTSQTRALRLRSFFADTDAGRYRGAYWSLGGGVKATAGESGFMGYSQALTDEVLERIRTDLDAFSEAEMSVLENHGYWSAERSVRKHDPDLIAGSIVAAASPYPQWLDEARVRRALRDSHKRLSLRRLFGFPRHAGVAL
jgi:NTE family protein